jgi:light-regulated signal transduction histidine kinase (bacteriophytochrome)
LLEAFVDVSRQKKAEQALERSNQELNDFAYIASHDLKEPLRGIANYSSFLMEDYGDRLDEEGQAKLATLIKLCRREESLIDALLSYSRVGRTDLRIERQSIKKLVDEVVSSISHMTQKEGVMLRIDPSLPDVACDRVWTGQVFYNLITNALKYNDKEEKFIEIGRLAPSETRAALPVELGVDPPVFFIRDNGIGIREKHLKKIFSIFKRLHGRDKFGGGTGAGLTIVEKIILRHGGRIWVESDFGSGSTFYFTLGRTR